MCDKKYTKVQLRRSGFFANLAPDAFRQWADHYLECEKSFTSPNDFSPVPYFLLCRAIELSLKSIHLEKKGQPEVKDTFGHDIKKAYDLLDEPDKNLFQEEYDLLSSVSLIYDKKDFEYFNAEDILSANSRYPNINDLRKLATRLVSYVNDSRAGDLYR